MLQRFTLSVTVIRMIAHRILKFIDWTFQNTKFLLLCITIDYILNEHNYIMESTTGWSLPVITVRDFWNEFWFVYSSTVEMLKESYKLFIYLKISCENLLAGHSFDISWCPKGLLCYEKQFEMLLNGACPIPNGFELPTWLNSNYTVHVTENLDSKEWLWGIFCYWDFVSIQ